MPTVSKRTDLCNQEMIEKNNAADSSLADEKGHSNASALSSAVSSAPSGQTKNLVSASGDVSFNMAVESIAGSGNPNTAGAASSREQCIDDKNVDRVILDDVEMVDVSGGAKACSSAPANSTVNGAHGTFNFYDAGDTDYRRQPLIPRPVSSMLYGKTYSRTSERPGYYANTNYYVNSRLNNCTSYTSSAVDMSCFEDAEEEVTTTKKNEDKNAVTSIPKPATSSAIRQLKFDDEIGAEENVPPKEHLEAVSKRLNASIMTSQLPFYLRSPDGSSVPSFVHIRSLNSSSSNLDLSAARAAIGKSSVLGDPPVDHTNVSATTKQLKNSKKKFLKRQLQTAPEKFTAEQLPGYVGDRDIAYLVGYVEGSCAEQRDNTGKNNNKKKEKRKKTATFPSQEPLSPDAKAAVAFPVGYSSPADKAKVTQPDDAIGREVVDVLDVSGTPVPGTGFLVVERKKKKNVKSSVARRWPARPAVSGLPIGQIASPITFGSGHSSFVLPSSDRAADSSSCTDEMRSEADGDSYPSLVRLPLIANATAPGTGFHNGNGASLPTDSGACPILRKGSLCKESWASVAARGLQKSRANTSVPGNASAPEKASHSASTFTVNTDSASSHGQELAVTDVCTSSITTSSDFTSSLSRELSADEGSSESGISRSIDLNAKHCQELNATDGSHIGFKHDVGRASIIQSKLDVDEAGVDQHSMPLPGDHASDDVAVGNASASTSSDVSEFSRAIHCKGVEFVGLQRQLFLSMPSKISFRFCESDELSRTASTVMADKTTVCNSVVATADKDFCPAMPASTIDVECNPDKVANKENLVDDSGAALAASSDSSTAVAREVIKAADPMEENCDAAHVETVLDVLTDKDFCPAMPASTINVECNSDKVANEENLADDSGAALAASSDSATAVAREVIKAADPMEEKYDSAHVETVLYVLTEWEKVLRLCCTDSKKVVFYGSE